MIGTITSNLCTTMKTMQTFMEIRADLRQKVGKDGVFHITGLLVCLQACLNMSSGTVYNQLQRPVMITCSIAGR